MKAKNFALPDQTGKIHRLTDYQGKWVVLYFYPKDDTPGCTKEACGFRDRSLELVKKGAVILGVSKDTVKSHLSFMNKYQLNFPLLSDKTAETIKTYNAWGEKKFLGKTFQGTLRKTYLINPTGEIVKVWEKVNPLLHAQEVLDELDRDE